MKITVVLKDPDAFYDGTAAAVADDTKTIADPEEREAIAELRWEKANEALRKWVKYGEYLTVEFDTEKGEARVVPSAEQK